MPAIKTIVMATDFGDAARAGLRYGLAFARSLPARLHVVHVIEDVPCDAAGPAVAPGSVDAGPDTRQVLEDLVSAEDRQVIDVRTVLIRHSHPARAVLDLAREMAADLIIVGTHGRSDMTEFVLGTVAQQVVRRSACPVLTVRADEHERLRPDPLAGASGFHRTASGPSRAVDKAV